MIIFVQGYYKCRDLVSNDWKKRGIMNKIQKSRKLTKEEVKEITINSIKRVKPYLLSLERWRLKSLDSKFRF